MERNSWDYNSRSFESMFLEFKNQIMDKTLEVFKIERSLSMKGCPYDNAVAEATYKVIKTEFVKNKRFETLEQLGYEFAIMLIAITIIEFTPH